MMDIFTRQQKREMMRIIEKKRSQWRVQGWQPMKFIRKEIDPVEPERDQAIFQNNLYRAVVRRMSNGMIHISFRNITNGH